MILDQRIHRATRGQPLGDRTPIATEIGTAQQIRFEITLLVVVESGVQRVRIVLRKQHARDIAALGHARETLDATPGSAAIGADLDQAIVGANRKQPFDLVALGKRNDVAVERSRGVLGD